MPDHTLSGKVFFNGQLIAEGEVRLAYDFASGEDRTVTEHNLDGQGRSVNKDCPFCRKVRAVWNERFPSQQTEASLLRDDIRAERIKRHLTALGVRHTCEDGDGRPGLTQGVEWLP